MLVALKAAALNYRDLMFANGMYPGGGVLSEYRLFDERDLVAIPEALSFAGAASAYRHLRSGAHFGKVVVAIDE